MSLWKTLAAAIGGGIAVGLGVQLGKGQPPAAARLNALEKRVSELEQPRAQENTRLETIIQAVAHLAEHSGQMEKRIKDIDRKLDSLPLEQLLEERLMQRFNFLEATLQSHAKSIGDLATRTTAGERAWTELVTRMEQLCRNLGAEGGGKDGVVVMKPRDEQKWRWPS